MTTSLLTPETLAATELAILALRSSGRGLEALVLATALSELLRRNPEAPEALLRALDFPAERR